MREKESWFLCVGFDSSAINANAQTSVNVWIAGSMISVRNTGVGYWDGKGKKIKWKFNYCIKEFTYFMALTAARNLQPLSHRRNDENMQLIYVRILFVFHSRIKPFRCLNLGGTSCIALFPYSTTFSVKNRCAYRRASLNAIIGFHFSWFKCQFLPVLKSEYLL